MLISASSGVMALAIQVISQEAATPISAVTRPPPPRTVFSSPSWSRVYEIGPRLETRISSCSKGHCFKRPPVASPIPAGPRPVDLTLQFGEDLKIVPEQAGSQVVCPDMFLACPPHDLCIHGIVQYPHALLGTLLNRVHQVSRLAIVDLLGDAADVAADGRLGFPQTFADSEAETFTGGFLDDDISSRLKGVHFQVAHVVQVGKDENIAVVAGMLHSAGKESPAFGIVGGHGAD